MKTKMHCPTCKNVTEATSPGTGIGNCKVCNTYYSTFWDFKDDNNIEWRDLGPLKTINYNIDIGKPGINYETNGCKEVFKINVSDKKLHNHIRNIVINELGADKLFIQEIIENRVDKFIKELFEDNYSSFRSAIMERVEREMSKGLKKYYANGHNNLQQILHDHIQKYVKEWIETKYTLDIDIKDK